MRHLLAQATLVCAALLAATPANATGGFTCRTASEPSIAIELGFGHTAGTALFAQRLRVDGREIPALAPQWWLDDGELRLVLTDMQANERLAVVRAERKGGSYDGSVIYRGKRHWIRCYES